ASCASTGQCCASTRRSRKRLFSMRRRCQRDRNLMRAGNGMFIEIQRSGWDENGAFMVYGSGLLSQFEDDIAPSDRWHPVYQFDRGLVSGVIRAVTRQGERVGIEAEITDPVAITKVIKRPGYPRTYRGFDLAVLGGVIRRAALVDFPGALSKANASQPAFLQIAKGVGVVRRQSAYEATYRELVVRRQRRRRLSRR